jgi:hypothetical protein
MIHSSRSSTNNQDTSKIKIRQVNGDDTKEGAELITKLSQNSGKDPATTCTCNTSTNACLS